MKSILLFSLCVLAATAFSSKDRSSELIYGGSDAAIGQFPWFVQLQMTNKDTNATFLCGGSLITKRHVLTAAHCLEKSDGKPTARLALVDNSDYDAPTTQTVEGKREINHPDYVGYRSYYNDIAIVELESEVEINENVTTIAVYRNDTEILNTTEPIAIGFGTYTYDMNLKGIASQHLLFTPNFPFADFDYCKKEWATFPPYPLTIWEKQLCAGGDQKGVAAGDSGGPLQVKMNKTWYQVGLVSMGPNAGGYVIPDQAWIPALYTRLSQYCDFMAESTGNEFQCIDNTQ